MEPLPCAGQEGPVKEAPQSHSLPYFLASLAGIAQALEDFGYHGEAQKLFGVMRELEKKVSLPAKK